MSRRLLLIVALAASLGAAPAFAAIPGARNVDHVGFVVPDLAQAERFFVDVIGAKRLYRFEEGPGTDTPADLHKSFAVDPRASLRGAMLRLGPNLNLELMQYAAPGQRRAPPANSDIGASHLAFYVDDVDVAGRYLQAHGCRLLGGPNPSPKGPKAGQVIRYCETPWGLTLEIVHRPPHEPYERGTAARLYGPAPSWN